MFQPETSSDPTHPQSAQRLDYATRHTEAPKTGAGQASLRIGTTCWIMYVLIAIAAIVLHHYLTDSDTALFFAALGVALVIVVNLFALIGFCTACASLKREGREWRGVMGFIVNALALWPVWYIVTCLLIFGR